MKFPEIAWSVLQHYEVCDTPLIDVTHSLRVACSFALEKGEKGQLYVLGFPHPTGGITYSVEEELLTVRLLSVCPPRAVRPYYQEGYLVGSFPSGISYGWSHLDVAKRVVAKFSLIPDDFWDNEFPSIPMQALYPKPDFMSQICRKIKCKLAEKGMEYN